MSSVYQPSDDSYLLQKYVRKLVWGRVLDMGTGSGIQAVTAAQKPEVNYVYAVDVNLEAIEVARKRTSDAGLLHKIMYKKSNLFDEVEGQFDWILFNPPYLQSEGILADPTWDGGERGCETIERFLDGARRHLTTEGSILLIFSSETGQIFDRYEYKLEILEELPLFFERLYCARLSQS
jgi:release factor glutamine methyltransferase